MNKKIKQKRLTKALKGLNKSRRRLDKAKSKRRWIEKNPKINIITYPYYKFKRMILHKKFKKAILTIIEWALICITAYYFLPYMFNMWC